MKNLVNRIGFFFLFGTFSLHAKAPESWGKTHYIWNLGLRQGCDVGVDCDPYEYFSTQEFIYKKENYQNLKDGDIVWLRPPFLKPFYNDFMENLDKKIVLVICDGDESFPKNCGLSPTQLENLLASPYVLHVFTQNFDYKGLSKKVSPIPIGIDFHSVAFKGGYWGMTGSPKYQEEILQKILQAASPTRNRKKRAFVDFQHSESMRASFARYKEFGEDRASIFEKIKNSGVVDSSSRYPREELWRKKSEYAFSVSPWGNGLDCHRTWEDLVLGCIVIVKTSSLDPLYEGLPVVIVNDWDEIHEENLNKWFHIYQDASVNENYREKLTHNYWMKKIVAKRNL